MQCCEALDGDPILMVHADTGKLLYTADNFKFNQQNSSALLPQKVKMYLLDYLYWYYMAYNITMHYLFGSLVNNLVVEVFTNSSVFL